MMQDISNGAIDLMVERFATVPSQVPSPLALVFFQQVGNRVDATSTAFSHRGVLCEWDCRATWLERAEDLRNIQWEHELARGWRIAALLCIYFSLPHRPHHSSHST
jgi:hypothetical protein